MPLHICELNQRGSDLRGEWVKLVNDGPAPVNLGGLELTDYTHTQQHVHVIHLPPDTLQPGQRAFVFSAPGRNQWVRTADGGLELHLYAGRRAPVWNNDGDVAYLRNRNGTFVDTFIVGSPRRHPGH